MLLLHKQLTMFQCCTKLRGKQQDQKLCSLLIYINERSALGALFFCFESDSDNESIHREHFVNDLFDFNAAKQTKIKQAVEEHEGK